MKTGISFPGLLVSFFLSVFTLHTSGQAPQVFSYQAVARSSSGDILAGQQVNVSVSIVQGSANGTVVCTEDFTPTTNAYGLFTLEVGSLNPADFATIDWSAGPYFLRTSLNGSLAGTSQLLSVPYALHSWETAAISPGGVRVQGDASQNDEEALFEVKRNDGQTVFSVYPTGVRMYVEDLPGKGSKGGFAVGGFNQTKGITDEYFRVTPDSVRIYVEDQPDKGSKGGFAVGGFNQTKGISNEYLRITPDSVRIYIENPLSKGPKGGFAVGGFNQVKGLSEDYFAVSGRTMADIIYPSQPVMLWYPRKEAFLVGRVLIESPDSVGFNAMATGFESKAPGNWSQAMGYQSAARGEYSTAIGIQSAANAFSSFAIGNSARAVNEDSYAFGYKALANGRGSYAFGYNARALGQDAYSFGAGTEATGEGSFAIGFIGRDSSMVSTGNTKATAPWAMAFGMGSQSTEQGAFAIGTQCEAQGGYSTAMGNKSKSTSWNSTAIGHGAWTGGEGSVSIGSGTMASGQASVSLGNGSHADNVAAVAIGHETLATGYISTAIGWGSVASGNGAISVGSFCNSENRSTFAAGSGSRAAGEWSLAIGHGCISTGTSSLAMGEESTATGEGAVAIGWRCTATGGAAFASGSHTVAEGGNAIALGGYTLARGGGSFAINGNNIAYGQSSFAAGDQTRAVGDLAASFGTYTTARPYASLVIGRYNDTSSVSTTTWDPSDPILIIGNGMADNLRSNALTLLKDGRMAVNHTSPTEVLDVNGNARFRHISSGTYYSDLNITDDGTLTKPTSDISMKENIRPAGQSLEKVLALQGIEFNWINDPAKRTKLGFVAQEVENVIPEVVFTNPVDGLKGINYQEITPILVEAIKEQQALIESLEKRIEELERKQGQNILR